MNFIRKASFFPFFFLILLLINSISIRLYLYNQRWAIYELMVIFFFFFFPFFSLLFDYTISAAQCFSIPIARISGVFFFLLVPFRHISLNICFSFIERVNATACIEISKQISHIYLHQLNMRKRLDIIMIY